ncbi:MAG: alpha/beta hydrolase [Caulobacterales bacterium]
MPSTHLVDPELRPLLEVFPALPVEIAALPAARAGLTEMMMAAAEPLPDSVERSELFAAGPKGAPDVRMLVYAPKQEGADRPAVLHVHGGGYVAGSPEMQETQNAALALELDAVVVSVDYRLAPETRFPGAIEDCYAALAWMVAEAADLGIDPRRIAISGESAGGGLAAALAVLARDRKEIPIAFQRLIYPMIDDRTASRTDLSPFIGQFIWTKETNAFGWSCLLGAAPGGPDVSPYAAAARAEDLSGLPPAFIACGALDLFLEENVAYAERLIRAGVPTELLVYPGAPHGFTMMRGAAVSQRFERDAVSALKRGLGVV